MIIPLGSLGKGLEGFFSCRLVAVNIFLQELRLSACNKEKKLISEGLFDQKLRTRYFSKHVGQAGLDVFLALPVHCYVPIFHSSSHFLSLFNYLLMQLICMSGIWQQQKSWSLNIFPQAPVISCLLKTLGRIKGRWWWWRIL